MKTPYTTCKLIFEHGKTEADVVALLKKYTDDGTVATFNSDVTVGCNRTAYAVVDVPDKVVRQLVADSIVREVDPLTSYSKSLSMAESCGPGGCCGGGCSP